MGAGGSVSIGSGANDATSSGNIEFKTKNAYAVEHYTGTVSKLVLLTVSSVSNMNFSA